MTDKEPVENGIPEFLYKEHFVVTPTVKEPVGGGMLRWVAMPFAAVIGALFGAFALALFIRMTFAIRTGGLLNDLFLMYITPVLIASIFGWVYVLIVYAMSPRFKATAVVVMTTILCVIGAIVLVGGWVFASDDADLAFRATLQIITAIIVAVLVAKFHFK